MKKPPNKFVFKRREPEIPSRLTTIDAFPDPDDVYLSECHLEGLRLDAPTDAPLRIESSLLNRVNLANNRFSTILWKDLRLTNCDLANLETRSLTLIRVEFINCRMTGLRATEAECQDVLISEGDLRYTQFRYAKFKAAEFDTCNFEEADFLGADLSGSIFRKCNLQNAEMNKVKLVNADLRTSNVEGLHLRAEDVRGAVVDLTQAMLFAPLLGIRIE